MSMIQCVQSGRSVRQWVLVCMGVSALLPLSGCALLHPHARSVAAASAAPAPASEEAPAPAPQTDTELVADEAADADTGITTTVLSDASVQLKPNAPKNYVVKRGDTLWGISNLFLRNPWQWPEIWYVNPQIRNPHRIYPGDTVRLALATDGHTVLQLVRGPAAMAAAARLEPMLRSSPLTAPIDAIPYGLIAAFISHPGVLTREEVERAPYIVALAQDHDIAGTGHEIYVKKTVADAGARYNVMHVDEPLYDPDSGRKLGYVAIFTGTAQITRPGHIAEAVMTSSARETLQGDLLLPDEHQPVSDFIPHPPQQPVQGHVIDVIDNVMLAGQYQVVALNRGSDDGLDRGTVLTIEQQADSVPDNCAAIENVSTCVLHATVTLPTDPAGTLLVFRTYPHLSYALILDDTVPVVVGDAIHNP